MARDIAWGFHAPPGTSVGYEAGSGLDGSRAVKLTGSGSSPNGAFALLSQRVVVGDLTGRQLTLRVHLRLVDVEGAVAIALRGDDPALGPEPAESFSTTQRRGEISGSADWAVYSVQLQDLDASIGIISAFVILLSGTTGNVYVDGVTLSSGLAVRPLALLNGGFEAGEHAPDHWWWAANKDFGGFTWRSPTTRPGSFAGSGPSPRWR